MLRKAHIIDSLSIQITASILIMSVKGECAINYRIINISPKLESTVTAGCLNDNNDVIAYIGNPLGGIHVALFKKNILNNLNIEGYPKNIFVKINNNECLLGFEQVQTSPNLRVFYLDKNFKIHRRQAYGECQPSDMNANNEIIGLYRQRDKPLYSVAFWNAAGSFKEIHLPYNDLHVLGWITNSDFLVNGVSHTSPKFHTLIVNSKSGNIQHDIRHDSEWVVSNVRSDGAFVGYREDASGKRRPFIFLKGGLNDLITDIDLEGEAIGINTSREIVGTTYNYQEATHTATIWVGNNKYDLNKLCINHSGWTLSEAVAINARGTILCQGKYEGRDSACLLLPVQ
ncbi:hypothetical protein CCAX7_46590 [Capsulimonas corticalis]|uniref:Uncharacterized protein n=1 Tax=Capsulimonas corticalis TaxID=2219043 RepID=A0A402D546_9BACT|nr:hypothetical protein CCAX7_46590 [Capsulimonas corticalis]